MKNTILLKLSEFFTLGTFLCHAILCEMNGLFLYSTEMNMEYQCYYKDTFAQKCFICIS